MNLRNLVDVAELVSADRFDRVHSTTYPRRCHFQCCFKVHGLAMGQKIPGWFCAGSRPKSGSLCLGLPFEVEKLLLDNCGSVSFEK